jgi:hypothetical protein
MRKQAENSHQLAPASEVGIEATSVAKAPEAETRMAGTIFKKKKQTDIRGACGFYIPQ